MSEKKDSDVVLGEPTSNGCGLTAGEKNKIAEESEVFQHLRWKYEFARRRFNQLLNILDSEVEKEIKERLIRSLGCECSKTVPFIQEYIGNPEGYWAEIEKQWGEKAEFDQAGGIITITTPERDCFCPLVSRQQTAPSFCNCSLGWQKQTYETIFGRPVEVELKASVLRGAKRCIFEIRLK